MPAHISTRSRREAMDWSLALISQEIESTIEHSDSGWGLTLSEEDLAHAEEVIRRYQNENRHWPWRREIREQLLFDWGALAWVFLMAVFFWIQTNEFGLRGSGLMDSAAVTHGQWWRLFTAISLHADLAHLTLNLTVGVVLLGLAMGRYGTGVGLLAAYLCGVGGNLATWLIFPEHRSLGASGMVMGCVGLLAAQVFRFRGNAQGFKYTLTSVLGGAFLFILLGLSPDSDVLAHFGGFISGLILGTLLLWPGPLGQNVVANLIAGGCFTLLMVSTWWLALSSR